MTSRNVLMVIGVVVALMGVWSLLAQYAGFPSFGVSDPVWHAVAKVLIGGFGVYVAYSDK
jgi:hypothetical protein